MLSHPLHHRLRHRCLREGRLDADGNPKAAEAVKNRAERASDPNAIARTDIRATVKGTLDGGTLKVESIEVQ
jgi:hypothetical protein